MGQNTNGAGRIICIYHAICARIEVVRPCRRFIREWIFSTYVLEKKLIVNLRSCKTLLVLLSCGFNSIFFLFLGLKGVGKWLDLLLLPFSCLHADETGTECFMGLLQSSKFSRGRINEKLKHLFRLLPYFKSKLNVLVWT